MELNAQGYLNFLRLHLNVKDYEKSPVKNGEITLREKVFGKTGAKPKEYRVKLKVTGDVLVLKLDTKVRGKSLPLLHFLDDTGKPWSKRCDFVIFNARGDDLFVYCLEFKSESIPHDVQYQSKASADWIRSLHAIVRSYTTKTTVMRHSELAGTFRCRRKIPAARSHDTPLLLCRSQWHGACGFGQQQY